MGAAGGGRVGREKAIVSGSGNSDRRRYMGGAGETESVLVAFFFFCSSDIISRNFLLVSCKEVIISSFRSFYRPIKVSILFSLFGPMANFSVCAKISLEYVMNTNLAILG